MKSNRISLSFIGCLFCLACYSGNQKDAISKQTNSSNKEWKLVWSDEFDTDGAPDSKNWSYETGFVRNNELQDYKADRKTSYIKKGKLVLTAYKDPHDGYKKTGE